jgi:hypothetical protein
VKKIVLIKDNFFSEEDLNIINKNLSTPNWGFKGGGSYKEFSSNFWHMDDLEKNSFFNDYLFNKICNKFKKKFKLLRCYANGQTSGQSGIPHFDDGNFTFLLFLTKDWKHYWGGNLYFNEYMEEDPTELKTIVYKYNRGVLFPANIMHYAGPPTKYYNGLRISLAWKML